MTGANESRRTSDVELAVLSTEFKNLTGAVAQMAARMDSLDSKIDRLAFVHPDVYLADRQAEADRLLVIQKNFDDRLQPLESFKEWFFRLLAGGVLVGSVGFYVIHK